MLPAFAQVGLVIHEIVCSRSAEVRSERRHVT
jgi:hypothetical protein